MAPKKSFLDFLKMLAMLVFLGNNLKWKLTFLLIFHYYIWQSSGYQVMGQNAASHQFAGFSNLYYLTKEVDYEVCFLHADKHWSLLQGDTTILGECNQACPKYPKWVCIYLQHFHKSMGDEVDFLPADKYKSFEQDDSITYDVHKQTCSNYPKQQV